VTDGGPGSFHSLSEEARGRTLEIVAGFPDGAVEISQYHYSASRTACPGA